jgi:uncharacterized protein (DUF983 family)
MTQTEPGAPQDRPPPSPFLTGPLGRCPRCGKGRLFGGFLTLAKRCEACGLDLTFADPGDGPAFFASFIGSTLLLLAGVTLQVAYEPPFWVYVVPLVVGTVLIIGLIRPIKGLLVALQFANKAEQGRFE